MTDRTTRARWTPMMAVLLPAMLLCVPALPAQQGPVWNNPPEQTVPGVEHRSFHSAAMGTEVGYNLLLPPGYATDGRRYPVLYWLHGVGGNENSVVRHVARGIMEAMGSGAVPPAIVVFVNGGPASFYADSPDGAILAETAFVSELVPHVDTAYRTIAERGGRAIEGYSMGGFGALAIGMKHAGTFGSVIAYAPALLDVGQTADGTLTLARAGGTHAGAPPLPPAMVERNKRAFERMFGGRAETFAKHSPWAMVRNGAAMPPAGPAIRIVVGTADGLWNANRLFHELMTGHGHVHEFDVVQGTGHDLAALYAAMGAKGLTFHARAGGWR